MCSDVAMATSVCRKAPALQESGTKVSNLLRFQRILKVGQLSRTPKKTRFPPFGLIASDAQEDVVLGPCTRGWAIPNNPRRVYDYEMFSWECWVRLKMVRKVGPFTHPFTVICVDRDNPSPIFWWRGLQIMFYSRAFYFPDIRDESDSRI